METVDNLLSEAPEGVSTTPDEGSRGRPTCCWPDAVLQLVERVGGVESVESVERVDRERIGCYPARGQGDERLVEACPMPSQR